MNRSQNAPGMVKAGGAAFNVFTDYGWEWGGFEKKGTDYMHFRKMINSHYRVERMIYRSENDNPQMPESGA